jgi:alpha-D-ribose 1-methylphosphonate 5-triphosphate synthase subunit PhnH
MTGSDDLPTLPPDGADGFVSITRAQILQILGTGDVMAAQGFVVALLNRLDKGPTSGRDALSRACADCMLTLAEHMASGIWVDRLFRVHAEHRWTMLPETVERLHRIMGTLTDVPKEGQRAYQRVLDAMARDGAEVPLALTASLERWLSPE